MLARHIDEIALAGLIEALDQQRARCLQLHQRRTAVKNELRLRGRLACSRAAKDSSRKLGRACCPPAPSCRASQATSERATLPPCTSLCSMPIVTMPAPAMLSRTQELRELSTMPSLAAS